jgi:hypothetical protein
VCLHEKSGVIQLLSDIQKLLGDCIIRDDGKVLGCIMRFYEENCPTYAMTETKRLGPKKDDRFPRPTAFSCCMFATAAHPFVRWAARRREDRLALLGLLDFSNDVPRPILEPTISPSPWIAVLRHPHRELSGP